MVTISKKKPENNNENTGFDNAKEIKEEPQVTKQQEPATQQFEELKNKQEEYVPEKVTQNDIEEAKRREKLEALKSEEENNQQLNNKRKRGKSKDKKQPKNRKVRNNKKENNEPITVEGQYRKYRTRKIIVFVLLIIITIALIFFGTYNTFFKHQLTETEAAVYTNKYNNQGSATQQFDSGIQGFLYVKAPELLEAKYQGTNDKNLDKTSYEFDNISIERNLTLNNETFLTFFSVDVIMNGQNERVYCSLPIKINQEDDKLEVAGDLEISMRESYSDPKSDKEEKNTKVETTEFLEFTKNNKQVDSEIQDKVKTTVDNFLTLAYNEKKDYSSIYTGKSKLDFSGEYLGIDSIETHNEGNKLGYNTKVTYRLRLSNGFIYLNTAYMNVQSGEKGVYNISKVL